MVYAAAFRYVLVLAIRNGISWVNEYQFMHSWPSTNKSTTYPGFIYIYMCIYIIMLFACFKYGTHGNLSFTKHPNQMSQNHLTSILLMYRYHHDHPVAQSFQNFTSHHGKKKKRCLRCFRTSLLILPMKSSQEMEFQPVKSQWKSWNPARKTPVPVSAS